MSETPQGVVGKASRRPSAPDPRGSMDESPSPGVSAPAPTSLGVPEHRRSVRALPELSEITESRRQERQVRSRQARDARTASLRTPDNDRLRAAAYLSDVIDAHKQSPNLSAAARAVFTAQVSKAKLDENLETIFRSLGKALLVPVAASGQDEGRIAAVQGGSPTVELFPAFFLRSPDERCWTLIHEATHLALGTLDRGYLSSRLIGRLTAEAALGNPDSYVWFVRLMRGEKVDVGVADEVAFTGESGQASTAFLGLALEYLARFDDLLGTVSGRLRVAGGVPDKNENALRTFIGRIKSPPATAAAEQGEKPLLDYIEKLRPLIRLILAGLDSPVTVTRATATPGVTTFSWFTDPGSQRRRVRMELAPGWGADFDETLGTCLRQLLRVRTEVSSALAAGVLAVGRQLVPSSRYDLGPLRVGPPPSSDGRRNELAKPPGSLADRAKG